MAAWRGESDSTRAARPAAQRAMTLKSLSGQVRSRPAGQSIGPTTRTDHDRGPGPGRLASRSRPDRPDPRPSPSWSFCWLWSNRRSGPACPGQSLPLPPAPRPPPSQHFSHSLTLSLSAPPPSQHSSLSLSLSRADSSRGHSETPEGMKALVTEREDEAKHWITARRREAQSPLDPTPSESHSQPCFHRHGESLSR